MRKTFKKLLAMALAATMVVSMAACGGDEGTTGNATPTAPATSGSENAGTTEKKDLDKLREIPSKIPLEFVKEKIGIKTGKIDLLNSVKRLVFKTNSNKIRLKRNKKPLLTSL